MLKLADLAVREEFTLGRLQVDPALRLIKGPAGEIHVEPLTMQVFLLLADAKGQVVTRSRLYDECWGGLNVGEASLNRAISMVRRIAAETAPGAFRVESIPRTGYRLMVEGRADGRSSTGGRKWRRGSQIGAAFAAVAAVGAGAWFLVNRAPVAPGVAIAAASDEPSAELAADIASAAMSTAAEYQTPLRVLAGGAPVMAADLVLEVKEASTDGELRIDLALLADARTSLLWSWTSNRPRSEAGPLSQQARAIAASVVACAAETQTADTPLADHETMKLYLDACSRFEPWSGARLALLPDAFQRVTERAPKLRGAWSKLFLSKAEAIEGFPPVDLSESLKKDLQASRAEGIEVPETYIAEAAVLPLNARFERLARYDAGLARFPRSLALLTARSWQLRSVGRMTEAARAAAAAAQLYPQSAAASTEYVQSLMSAGRTDAARAVLDRASASSPDSPNLESVRWRLELRYGDPQRALEIARDGRSVVDGAMISYLDARANPSKANVDRAIGALLGAYRKEPREPGLVAQAMSGFGRTDDAIAFLLQYPYGGNSGDGAEMLFRPHMGNVRRDPRFILIARNFGVTDYWIRSGILPDFCFEPGLPYDCKRELAKLRS